MIIAILGSTSQIAQDLILSFSKNKSCEFLLFSRNIESIKSWLDSVNLSEQCQIKTYLDFNNNGNYDVIINFVGAGRP